MFHTAVDGRQNVGFKVKLGHAEQVQALGELPPQKMARAVEGFNCLALLLHFIAEM